MKIYVQSAGKTIQHDYDWKGDFDETTKLTDSNPPRSWHGNLKEGDKALALLAGYADGTWHVEYRNLILPGVTDFRGRQIVQNIIFSGLQSSNAVRALVHAYLDIELQFKNTGRPVGRICPELAACYSATDDGDFAFDCRKAEDWAKKIIDGYKPDALRETKSQRIQGSFNPASENELQQLHELIDALELVASTGLQIAFSQVSIVREPSLRLNLGYTNLKGARKEIEPPKPKSPKPSTRTHAPNLQEIKECLDKAEKWVENSNLPNPIKKTIPQLKKLIPIFLLLTLVGVGVLLFFQFSTKQEQHIAVKSTPVTATITIHQKGEQNQDKKAALTGDACDEKNASIDTTNAAPQGKAVGL